MTPIHLLLATDGSEPSLEAARMVRDLMNTAALSPVTILAVVAPITATPFIRMHRTVDSLPTVPGTTWPQPRRRRPKRRCSVRWRSCT